MNSTYVFKDMPISHDKDVPGKSALIITFDCGCPLDCYGCHYMISRKTAEKISFSDALPKIMKIINGGLVDCVVLNGGEFFSIGGDKVYSILSEFFIHSDIDVIINTNGMFPELVMTWSEDVSFHVDVKIWYSLYESINKISKKIIGHGDLDTYFKNLNKTLDIIYKGDSKNHLLRTVEYPIDKIAGEIMSNTDEKMITHKDFFDKIKNKITNFENKYKKIIPYYVNPYVEFKE